VTNADDGVDRTGHVGEDSTDMRYYQPNEVLLSYTEFQFVPMQYIPPVFSPFPLCVSSYCRRVHRHMFIQSVL